METRTSCHDLFEIFFERKKTSTYTYAFLHALSDIGLYGKTDLTPRQWIHKDGGKIVLKFDFVAIRFIKYYWDISEFPIRHTSSAGIGPGDPKEIKILRYINDKKQEIRGTVDLEELAGRDMDKFRKMIIRESMRPEAWTSIKKSFEGLLTNIPRKSIIVLNRDMFDYLKANRSQIQDRIKVKIRQHLERLNPEPPKFRIQVDDSSPFAIYVNASSSTPVGVNGPSIFLMGIPNGELGGYERTIVDMTGQRQGEHQPAWGLRPTRENREIWGMINTGDIVLFSCENQCMGRGTVAHKLEDKLTGRKMWGGDTDARSLITTFDQIKPMRVDLENSRIKLISPAMYDEYNFPIVRVNQGLVDVLSDVYGGVEKMLDELSERVGVGLHDVLLVLKEGRARTRHGQEAFRKAVLQNYNFTCAACDINREDLLEASHILAVSDPAHAGEISNGICLCVLHHKMFDRGYLWFNPDGRLEFSDTATDTLRAGCTKTVITEDSCRVPPDRKYLEKSYQILRCQEGLYRG